MLHWIQRFRNDDSGQVLVIIALSMVVIMLMAAFAIDTATQYQKHHQDQVAADAAALAAANCLADAGSTITTDTCTSTTDTAHAQAVATAIAAANGLTITTGNVSVNTIAGTVSVADASTSPTLFDGVAGIHSSTTGASAVAGFTPGVPATCTSALESAGSCYAIYAANATCGTTLGLDWTAAGVTITGGVHTQGSTNLANGTYNFKNSVTYSNGTGSNSCGFTKPQGVTLSGNTPAAVVAPASPNWPANFATFFTACTSTCTGPGGTPSWCQYAAANYNFSSSALPQGGIECAYGTGTPATPSTWTGGFTWTNGPAWGTTASPAALTEIGGWIDLAGSASGGVNIKPATGADNCVIYAEESQAVYSGYNDPAVYASNGTYELQGDVFAPTGTASGLGEISLASTSLTTGFLEAQNVVIGSLTFTGDGPPVPGSASPTSGTDNLVQ
jgi:Flp pilus assembly protein TadG